MSHFRVSLLTCCVVLAALGCATGGTSGGGTPSPSSPMGARDEVVFDNGVDLVADPAGLQGQWFASWESDLDHRLARADLVALISVGSIARSEVEAEGQPMLVLVPEAQEVLRGSFPEDLALVSLKGGAGYASLDRGQTRLLDGRFVLFVKWAETAAGDTQARFHLSPAAGEVLRHVDAHFGTGPTGKTVVRHVN